MLETIPNYFDVISEHSYNGDYMLSGQLDNLRIKVKKNRLTIENSLCRWFLGNNIETLSREQTQMANEKLSDIFHIDINQAKVTRLDLARTFQMDYPVECYFDTLGKLNRFQRLEQPNGIIYRTKSKELIFYDKIKELKSKNEANKQHLINQLRYEHRFKNSLPKHFNRAEITPETLSEERFFEIAVTKYIEAYKQIQKNETFNLSFGNVKGVKGLSNFGIAYLLNNVTTHKLIHQITQDYKAGIITEKEKRGMKQKIKSIEKDNAFLFDSKFLNELNKKIVISL